MRAIGKGGAAARIFCGLMNLPPPPAKFERHNSLFLNVLKTISEDSMNAAVHEAVIANDNNSNIAVAVDGTWHKRGYSSLNGVVCATSVENGKWGNGMSGVLSIFQRSETSRKACYTQYLGDGDSKGFLTIKEAKVYGDTEVEKLECVGHVQKRMGTRLRNILKMSKGIKLSDGKTISGRGRLTLKEVDSIQHYYGLAIHKNLSSVEDMKRAIWAIYFHKLSTEDNPQHALCPLVNFIESEKSVSGSHREGLIEKKCLHGRTQNPNESFNKCIWERIPKTVFVGIETLKFGVMDAVICFNDGYVSRIIGKLEEGRSVTSVAAEFRIAHRIVSRLWRQFQTTGTDIRGFSSGRPRGTTPADDRYIVLQARRNRRQTAGEIARHTTQAAGRPISRFTVARRLHGGGLFARRPVRCVPLTPAHRRRRSLWCREHQNWRDNEWGRVLFTDESRFSLSRNSHRILIWRERGSRNHPSNIIERDMYGDRGVLVWGGIILGSRTDLHIFDAGSVNGTRY
ncbi:transposable element Tc3 transposase [Trichonephila clavipes]|nr:transposable element Tc3 transposase [Trichonephila clavipes]